MKKFEAGRKYFCCSVGDHDCVWTFLVESRTPKFVTIVDVDTKEIRKCKVEDNGLYGCEVCRPFGKFSMCPVLRAENEVK